MEKYALIADIGGTNIRLSITGKNLDYQTHLKYYKCKNFPNIEDAIKHYLSKIPSEYKPSKAIIAVAGAIKDDNVSFQNNPWKFSIIELQKTLGLEYLKVINDFEAQGYAVEYITEEDTFTIKETKNSLSNGRKLVLGPGTGLGVAMLYFFNNAWEVIATEGGNSILGSYTKKEQAVFDYIRKTLNKESYAEVVISGSGIINIYNGLCSFNGISAEQNISSRTIVDRCRKNKEVDDIYNETIDTFFNFLGTFTSSMALSYLPFDGIYMTGGILPALKEELKQSDFISRYLDRSMQGVKDIVEKTPIYLITKEDPAMFGLAKKANSIL